MWNKLIYSSIIMGIFAIFFNAFSPILSGPLSASNEIDSNENSSPSSHFSAYVDDQGNISFPHEYRKKWQHLGTWSVAGEGEDNLTLHNVYSPPHVAEEYLKTGTFPDGAPILKEVVKTHHKTLTTGEASWSADTIVRFFMIKDQKNRFPENPLWGDGWGWALFNEDNTNDQVAKDYKSDCLECHIPAKDTDWIYVDGYPALKSISNKLASTSTRKSMADTNMPANSTKDDSKTLKLGEKVFKRCIACHSLNPGVHKLGPSLAGVANRKAGFWQDYKYSDAIKNSGITWTRENLDAHLSDVKNFIKGNRMGSLFPRGIKDETEREAVISYLFNK